MPRLYLVRHGRATAGWNVDPDPGLDDLGRQQAERMADQLQPLGPLALLSSPLLRCQQTAAVLSHRWSVAVTIEPRVAEIPSPEGVPMTERVEWLRLAMSGEWASLGQRYTQFRDVVAACLAEITVDTVVASHFIAINAAIGAACNDDRVVIRSLDNCSITIIDVVDGRLHFVEGGHEADTLIR
jgi:broad specificity phosphatase PhoE